MLRKLALIVAISPVMWFSAVYALGLGDIDVNSHLNQRFSAVIPLTSVSADDAENLLVRLGDSEDFNKAGIERTDYLSSLNFQVVADAKNPHILITSKQIAREPFLSFLLDVRGGSGRVLREYTVLLDPPAYGQAAPAAATAPTAKAATDFYQTAQESAQTKPQAAAAPAAVAPAPALAPAQNPAPTSAPAPDTAAVADTSTASSTAASAATPSTAYGPVQPQETFWSIATQLRPNPSVTMDQMLWALYSNNPQAFEGNSISGLLKGSTLKVPPLSVITSVSPEAAKQHVQALRGQHGVVHAKPKKTTAAAESQAAVTAPAPAAPKPAAAPASTPAVPATAEKKTPETVTPPPAAPAPAKPAVAAAPATPAPAPAPTPAPAAAEPVQPAPTSASPVTQTETPVTAAADQTPPAPVEPTVVAPVKPATHSSSLLDDWMLPAVAGAVVLILALLGVRFWQKRQSEKEEPAPVLTSKASSNLQFWKKAAESAPIASAAKPTPPPVPPPVPPPSKPTERTQVIKAAAVTTPKPTKPEWDDEPQTLDQTTSLSSFDSTQGFDDHPSTPAKNLGANTDFDVTNSFEAQTLKVDLDANDPMSEADFHLAYGLYDEAALLLENAAEKNPRRTDIRVKLAETYFRASRPHEFDDVAQSLKPQLDATEWQKIAIMGSQLLPDSPLYKGAATESSLSDAVDLAFDEPAELIDTQTRRVAPTATLSPSARSNSSVLDFKLEDLEAPHVAPAPKPQPAPVSTGNTLEFNLTDFDLSKQSAAPGPAPKAASKPAPATTDHGGHDFDLGSFDAEPAGSGAHAAVVTDDINLDDFDLGELPGDSHAISAGDEAGTKLDLARAYVDMGDNDMARSLLNEVMAQGSSEQKSEAQTLIQRLA